MQPLRKTTSGYLRTALAMAAFLLACEPARASALLFAMPPLIGFSAPGASEALEVYLASTKPGPVMTAGFSFDLTTGAPAMASHTATASAPRACIFGGDSRLGPGIAIGLIPDRGAGDLAFAGCSAPASRGAVELGYVYYSIVPDGAPGDVFGNGVPGPDAGAPLLFSAGGPENGTSGDVYGPRALLPTGLLLIGLGALRERRIGSGRRRRRIPGVRKSPVQEGLAPAQAEPCARYVAV
jgi:hypothetical protein